MKHSKTPRAEYDDVPGDIIRGSIPEDADHLKAAHESVDAFNDLRKEHMTDNVVWRDLLSFTDTYRTFVSSDTVFDIFVELSKEKERSSITFSDAPPPRVESSGPSSWLDFNISFTVQHGSLTGRCAGIVSVTVDGSKQWKIWMIRTWLEHYEGYGHPDHLDSAHANGITSNGTHQEEQVHDTIIAGGGQAGLGLAGRLQALDVSYILFDDRPLIGDSWALRYKSLKWHTIREAGNLPFGRTFPNETENLLPIKRIGAGYKAWAERYGINAQSGTIVDSANWNAASQTWTVYTSGEMGRQEWKSKNLVLSIGPAARTPAYPKWATPEKIQASGFKGTIIHGANYREPKGSAGQRGVVIGTANTAHDVAEDMANIGMDTTMVQRSPTFILPGAWLAAWQSHTYNLKTSTEEADREFVTMPNKIKRDMANRVIWGLIDAHPEQFDALEKAGFRLDRYGDALDHVTNRYGGHYVDIGSCARIVSGEIKIKGGLVNRLAEDGLVFEDGSELKADHIVLCTGFEHDFSKDAAEIVGQNTADEMDNFGGIDAEGEIRGLSKYAGHPHLFYHGGETTLMRFHSRFMALQLQKQKLGEPLKPYMGN